MGTTGVTTSIFGIRHHGPGSARSLRRALESLSPDCVLVEGPPDAESVLPLLAHAEMQPPVALLIYDPENPQRSVYYPFAHFSPEWQAIQYALSRNIPVRFMDLPQSIQMGLEAEAQTKAEAAQLTPSDSAEEQESEVLTAAPVETQHLQAPVHSDPLSYLAQAAGYSDSERWWEHMVEHRCDENEVFTAVLEAMSALREAAIPSFLQTTEPENEARREAYMRQSVRAAQKEGFQRIAVVCGAWHAPALAKMPPAKDDAALLKGLPKRKTAATWIPWTYSRLASSSGYGAGIESPGWYDFLWDFHNANSRIGREKPKFDTKLATAWLARVARLLREEDLDASSASIIEAVRLAESLAAMRGRPLPGLPELNEATHAVLTFGDTLPLALISKRLIVSERLGKVPDETPMVPLAQDLTREQRRLRLPPEAGLRQLDLDLRKPNDLDRSRLLHRLNLLGIEWGERNQQGGQQKGTFHEFWNIQWAPEFAVALIEAGVWGNTIAAAAAGRVIHDAEAAVDLPALTALVDSVLLADLPEASTRLMARLQEIAAVSSDVSHLLGALPPLAAILRYGSVRQTDASTVGKVVDGLVARACIGLPGACGSLNDEAAEEMFGKILGAHSALVLLQNADHLATWHDVLRRLSDLPNLHGLIAGRACRLLYDAQQCDLPETARRFSLALSAANPPMQSAAWIDGFLRNSGLILLHDEVLWRVLDEWVCALSPDHFTAVLPLLRRAFASFATSERRQMGARVVSGTSQRAAPPVSSDDFDQERAVKALPLIAQLLGIEP